jgi:glycosyltransferase involved in cell wall biosynthesis/GR25 family glycosyltransferase involved in LPS biosynthesis
VTHDRDVQGRPWSPGPFCPHPTPGRCASRAHGAFCGHAQCHQSGPVPPDVERWRAIVAGLPAEDHPAREIPGAPPVPSWPHPDGRPRVGFLGPGRWSHGGTERWHDTLLPRLAGAGLQVVGYAVRHAEAGASPPPFPLGAGTLAMKALAATVDVLIAWGLDDLASLLPAAARPDVVWVAHCGDTEDLDRAAAAAPVVTRFVAVSHAVGAALAAVVDPDRITVIPNAVDPARVQPARDRATVRAELGLDEADVAVLSLARLAKERRVPLLADAVEQLGPPFVLLAAGCGEDLPTLQGRERVRLLGPRSDTADLLAAADLLTSPAEYEGFGLALVEAMLAGVPVVATPKGVVADDPDLARVVPVAAGAAEWAAAIRADWSDAPVRLRRAAYARVVTGERYGVEAHVAAWAGLIGGLAALPPVYVVNLARRPDRLAAFARQMDAAGVPFERVPGIDGAALDLSAYGPPPPDSRPGNIGNRLAHTAILRRIAAGEQDPVLICEDDAAFAPAWPARLRRVLREARSLEWDMLKLGGCYLSGPPRMRTANLAEVEKSYCLHAYVVTRAGARKILEGMQDSWTPLDNQIADLPGLRTFLVVPSLANPDGRFESDIVVGMAAPPPPPPDCPHHGGPVPGMCPKWSLCTLKKVPVTAEVCDVCVLV